MERFDPEIPESTDWEVNMGRIFIGRISCRLYYKCVWILLSIFPYLTTLQILLLQILIICKSFSNIDVTFHFHFFCEIYVFFSRYISPSLFFSSVKFRIPNKEPIVFFITLIFIFISVRFENSVCALASIANVVVDFGDKLRRYLRSCSKVYYQFCVLDSLGHSTAFDVSI